MSLSEESRRELERVLEPMLPLKSRGERDLRAGPTSRQTGVGVVFPGGPRVRGLRGYRRRPPRVSLGSEMTFRTLSSPCLSSEPHQNLPVL